MWARLCWLLVLQLAKLQQQALEDEADAARFRRQVDARCSICSNFDDDCDSCEGLLLSAVHTFAAFVGVAQAVLNSCTVSSDIFKNFTPCVVRRIFLFLVSRIRMTVNVH